MRTTINLDDRLVEQARELTGIEGKSALVNAALKALVELEGSLRLARLGGTQPQLKPIRRRRSRAVR